MTHRLGAAYAVSYSSTSAPSLTAIPSGVRAIRLCSTTACHVRVAVAPVAVAADTYLPANFPQVFMVAGGEKVAVIRDAADGVLSITELVS